MKKTLIIITAFVAAAFVSCTKEMELEVVASDDSAVENPSAQGTFSFSAVREDSATKSYLSGTDFLWEDGEEISVCYGASNVRFTYDGASGKFTSDAFDPEASGPFYVVAPYNAGITIDGSGKIHTELPALQTAGSHGLDPAALLSVGKAADVAALTAGVSLKNAFSLVKVAINDADVNRISIDGNYSGTAISPLIAGEVTVDPADGSAVATGRGTSVSLVPSAGNFDAGAYILAVLPQTMSNGIKIVFRREGEAQSYYRNSAKSISFTRNAGISFAAVTAADLESRCYFVADADDFVAWDLVGTHNGTDKVFLGADINMDGKSWTPVVDYAGLLDGQNHRIYNISVTTNQYVGIIRTNKNAASDVRNLVVGTADGVAWDGVSNFTHSASANNYTWYYAGAVAKLQFNATMENVTNFAKIEVAAGSVGKTRIGGICGNWASDQKIIGCVNYGLVVNNASATGQNSSSDTAVATSQLGGIIGQYDGSYSGVGDNNTVIESCINYGRVENNNKYVKWIGGILGASGKAVTIHNCINYGTVLSNVKAYTSWLGTGGIAGFPSNTGATIDHCSCLNASLSSASDVLAGIAAQTVGTISNCTVSNCTLSGAKFVTGILAYTKDGATVSDCQVINGTTISGSMEIGGIGGRLMGGVVSGCVVSSSTVSGTGEDVGGIIGWSQATAGGVSTSVSGCTVSGATISSNANFAGGIIGLAEKTTVSACSVSGSSISTVGESVGGIAGYTKNAGAFSFENCLVSDCVVRGDHNVGGIVGYAYSNGDSNVQNIKFVNCGTDEATVLEATDSDGTAPDGDAEVAGICGWIRLTTTGTFKVINCYCNATIQCDKFLNTLSAGGVVGYCSLGSGTGEITNFSSSLTAAKILVEGSPVSTSTRVGAIFGMLPNKTISVSNCHYISGLEIGDPVGANVTLSGNVAYAPASFADGTTVPAALNAYVGSYGGAETLKTWKANGSGNPVFND